MRWIATGIGCAGMLCLNMVWMFVFSLSPVIWLVWVQRLYIANLFLFGMAGAHWLGNRMWFMLLGALLFSYFSYIGDEKVSSTILIFTALKDSVLIVSCIMFGGSVYLLLFRKINMSR